MISNENLILLNLYQEQLINKKTDKYLCEFNLAITDFKKVFKF